MQYIERSKVITKVTKREYLALKCLYCMLHGVPDLDKDGDVHFKAIYGLSSTDVKLRRILRILCIYWPNTISNTRVWEITGQML